MISLAGCLIFYPSSTNVLALYRPAPRSRWETPGGKVEVGEASAEAVVREIREELGIQVAVGPLIATTTFHEDETEYSYDWFLGTIVAGQPIIQEPDKHERWEYLPWETLTTLSISPNFQQFLEQFPTVEAIHEI